MYLLVTLICTFNLSNIPIIKLTDSKCMSTVMSAFETKEECDFLRKEINANSSGKVAHCLKYSGKNLKIKIVK